MQKSSFGDRRGLAVASLAIAGVLSGCAHDAQVRHVDSTRPTSTHCEESGWVARSDDDNDETIRLASFSTSQDDADGDEKLESRKPDRDEGSSASKVALVDVTRSVRSYYPLLESALLSRNVAAGEQLSAGGAYDLKVKAASESGPLGFYETYRHKVGIEQPLYSGGSVFAGYRAGRGQFQPWYLERQTNDGGEFSAGVVVPLSRNRRIDEGRAELWRATYGRKRVEPEIQTQLIEFIAFGSFAFWDWVAAGRNVEIAKSLLRLATVRQEGLGERVKKGDLAKIVLTDNERLIVSRRAKLTGAEQKLRQAAVKLSLFLRQSDGSPLVPPDELLPASFPELDHVDETQVQIDIERALGRRPELEALRLLQRQLDVDLAQATNLMRPSLDAVISGSQDVGKPTSSKRDKSEFEFDAGLYLTVPVQRRKARGKIRAVEGKLAQLSAKRRFARDKIASEVQTVYAALTAAYRQVGQARRALELAKTMEDAERIEFEAGESNLLDVNIRESQTAAAAAALVDALLEYFRAQVAYRAALALEIEPNAAP